MTKNVCFCVEGEFITDTARDWFYKEGKPYQKCLDFLLSCMTGTDQSKKQLIQFAEDILLLKAKLVGNTSDGTYGISFSSDHYDLTGYAPGKISDDKWTQYLKNYLNYKKVSKDAAENIYVFIKEVLHKEEYGWLSPAGSFYPVPFGKHQQWAFEKIRKAEDLYDAFKSEYGYGWDKAGDFLIQKRWALLDNPRFGPAILQYHLETGLTKHQREFMFQYYSERGRRDEANRLYQGGEFI